MNRGCIPTKALLHGAEVYQSALNAASCGVTTGEVGFDFAKLAEYKDSVVAGLRKGIAGLEKAHGVKVINGFGKLVDEHTLDVDGEKITFDKLILATGSAPARPPIPGIDGENVITSDEVLSMTELPDSFVIIGGGVIGIEFATLFASLNLISWNGKEPKYDIRSFSPNREKWFRQPQLIPSHTLFLTANRSTTNTIDIR